MIESFLIKQRYKKLIDKNTREVIDFCTEIANKNNINIYLVGGLVRDLLLDVNVFDVDILIEYDAIKFAKLIIENSIKATIIKINDGLKTVRLKMNDIEFDIASTRSESYPKAGHLPIIDSYACSIQEDLARRDFSINSLAISLNKDRYFHTIDIFNGISDLKSGELKILHENSFKDDPTRILRAFKFRLRFNNLSLDPHTFSLQENYLNNITDYDICSSRLKSELIEIFNMNNMKSFSIFINEQIYKLFFDTFDYKYSSNIFQKLNNIPEIIEKYLAKTKDKNNLWLIYFALLLKPDYSNLKLNLSFTKNEKRILEQAFFLILNKKKFSFEDNFDNDFSIYTFFQAKYIEAILIYYFITDDKNALYYLDNLYNIKIQTTGKTLVELGLKPGKDFQYIFQNLLRLKISNPSLTSEEEIIYIKNNYKL